jgi:hypothetical protein
VGSSVGDDVGVAVGVAVGLCRTRTSRHVSSSHPDMIGVSGCDDDSAHKHLPVGARSPIPGYGPIASSVDIKPPSQRINGRTGVGSKVGAAVGDSVGAAVGACNKQQRGNGSGTVQPASILVRGK